MIWFETAFKVIGTIATVSVGMVLVGALIALLVVLVGEIWA
jgi:hypothetical protein